MTDEEIKALQGQCEALNAANLKNQQGWDAEIEGRKQDAEAYQVAIGELAKTHRDAISKLGAERQEFVDELVAGHQAELKAVVAEGEAALQAKDEQHTAEMSALKESVLVPALSDLHARQQADLAAQHSAELAKLQGAN